MTAKVIKQKIKSAVTGNNPTAEVILFGSQARGNALPESDWDVLVLLDQPQVTFQDEQAIRHRLYDVELQMETSISVFVYSRADWNTRHRAMPLFKSIQSEGIAL